VKALDASRTEGERITVMKLATHLNIGKMAASRRAKRALKEDWLLNRESRKGYPADFAIGDPMPETEGLPLLDCNTVTDRNAPLVTDSSLKNGECNTVTPLTDGDTPSPPGSLPDYPTYPCSICGCGDYWLREASRWGKTEWLCSRCHSKPSGKASPAAIR